MYHMYQNFIILIYVCNKSNLLTLEIWNIVGYIVMRIGLWAQEAIFTQVWVS